MSRSAETNFSLPMRPIHAFQRPPRGKRRKADKRLPGSLSTQWKPKSQLRDPVTVSRWCRMAPKIEELYVKKGYPVRLVQEIMMCIYQFEASDNRYKKRFKRREASKSSATAGQQALLNRAKRTPRPPVKQVPNIIIEKDDFDLHWHMGLSVPDKLELNQFTHHEQLLHSVDSFVRGVFDPGNKGWSADITDFVGPEGDAASTSLYYQWRSASDRCHSVALLVRVGHQGKAQATLEQLFKELAVLIQHRHPALIATIWRVCLRLLGVDSHIPQANAVQRLVGLVQESQADSAALRLLASSLGQMDQADLRHALHIGYLKAIKTMTELIGDENIMVLEMASHYCKFFDTHHLVRQTLIAKYEYVWHKTYEAHADGSRPTIAISYAYAYAAYYVFDCPYIAIDMAEKLRDTAAGHPHLANPPRWTIEAEAFAFASKTVAELYRQQVSRAETLTSVADEYAKCCASMQGAILKLESGDRECRTRAAMISRALNRWLVEWGLQQAADEEAVRTQRLLDSIEGKTCAGCIRVRYCRNCAPLVIEGKTPGERCIRCKPFKQSWLCQKCQLRKGKVGWAPSDAWLKVFRSDQGY